MVHRLFEVPDDNLPMREGIKTLLQTYVEACNHAVGMAKDIEEASLAQNVAMMNDLFIHMEERTETTNRWMDKTVEKMVAIQENENPVEILAYLQSQLVRNISETTGDYIDQTPDPLFTHFRAQSVIAELALVFSGITYRYVMRTDYTLAPPDADKIAGHTLKDI